MKETILKLNDIKSTNLQRVLDILLESDGLSRIELARKMGCDNTTVSRAVRELIARGIIIPGGKNEQEHGRPRVMLRLLGQSIGRPSLLASYARGGVGCVGYLRKRAGDVEKKI